MMLKKWINIGLALSIGAGAAVTAPVVTAQATAELEEIYSYRA